MTRQMPGFLWPSIRAARPAGMCRPGLLSQVSRGPSRWRAVRLPAGRARPAHARWRRNGRDWFTIVPDLFPEKVARGNAGRACDMSTTHS